MGNHEYCSGCGASDFHIGMSCEEAYPERWERKEAERAAVKAVEDAEAARVKKLTDPFVKGGRRAIVNRLIALNEQTEKIRKDREALKVKQVKLDNEMLALQKHCPHPPKYVDDNFMYVSCSLCGDSDI
jgi:hypothetical protein